MVSAKSIVGVFCYMFLMILGLQTFSDILNKEQSLKSMLVFTVSAIALILLGTYLIKMGEQEDEAKRAEKTRKRILKDRKRVNKLK
jgi:arginine exporter protein ArgO